MQSVYCERRQAVQKAMQHGALLVFSAPTFVRNNDVEHEYRQDSDFFYLTGLDEPDCALVLRCGASEPFTLFVRPRDPERETWDGERIGVDGAVEQFKADRAFPIAELATKLPELLTTEERLFYAIGRHAPYDELVLSALRRIRERSRRGDRGPTSIVEPGVHLHEMRLLKSSDELESVKKAIEITRKGHHSLFECTKPGVTEHALEGLLRQQFRALGSERCSYSPIVASGKNSRILHHRRNNRTMRAGELLLVDAGAEYNYMAADITRTIPVSGRFTSIQRRAYDVVLAALEEAFTSIRPGATLDDVHNAASRCLCGGLVELGILSGEPDELIDSAAFKKYYMHRTSHWLGMDVHDVGDYFRNGKARPLVPGMMFTIEPGLYFAGDDSAVPEGLRDCGIRIEDNVVVTENGATNLSASIARSAEDIETIMNSRQAD